MQTRIETVKGRVKSESDQGLLVRCVCECL